MERGREEEAQREEAHWSLQGALCGRGEALPHLHRSYWSSQNPSS